MILEETELCKRLRSF